MDIELPGINGVEGLKRVKAIAPSVDVVMLTVFDEYEKIFQAICSGASGYVLKSSPVEKIIESLQEILNGGAPMSPKIAKSVLTMFSKFTASPSEYGLTRREHEILGYLVEGYIKKEIATKTELSFFTIDKHMRNIYLKLNVHNRSGAVAKALKEHIF